MDTFFLWLCIWISSGLVSVILKMFVLFRGPDHMIQMHLLHDRTRVSTIKIYKSAKETVGEEKSVQFIIKGYFVFGILIAPMAIYDLITDTIIFSFFDVEKAMKKRNERIGNE